MNRSVDESSVLSCSYANNANTDSCRKGAAGGYDCSDQYRFSNDENAFNAPQSCCSGMGLNESNIV